MCEEHFIRTVVKEYQDVLQEIYNTLVVLNISKQKIIDRLTEVKNNVIDYTYVAISAKSELVIVVDEIKNFDIENNKLCHHILVPSEEEPYGYSEEYELDKVNTLLPNGNGTWQNLVFDKQPADILAIIDEYYKMAFASLEEQHSVALFQMMKVTKMQKVTPQSV